MAQGSSEQRRGGHSRRSRRPSPALTPAAVALDAKQLSLQGKTVQCLINPKREYDLEFSQDSTSKNSKSWFSCSCHNKGARNSVYIQFAVGNNPSCRLGRKQCVSITAHNTPACLAVFVFGLLGHFGVYSGAEAAPPWTMTCCFWKLLRQAWLCPPLPPRAASPSGRGAGPGPALSGRRARRTARQTHAEPEDTGASKRRRRVTAHPEI